MRQTEQFAYEIKQEKIVITGYRGCGPDVRIPETLDGLPVAEIGPEAFAECEAPIERVCVPGTVKRIGAGAFRMCMNLQELSLKSGLEEIGEDAFYFTPVEELQIPDTVKKIDGLREMGNLRLSFAENNPYFYTDGYAVYENNRSGKILAVVNLGDPRTAYCVEEGTVFIGPNAFNGQSYLKQVHLPKGLRSIGDEAFAGCRQLEEIVIPEGVFEIGAEAFSLCSGLKRAVLPSTLQFLGRQALTNTFDWAYQKRGLQEIRVHPSNPSFSSDESGFYQMIDGQKYLIKYFGTEQHYKVRPDVAVIGSAALRRASFRELTIPASVKRVEKYAFRECQQIETIHLKADKTTLYIPRTPVYRREEICDLLSVHTGKYLFDYGAYDALWETYLYTADRVGMACCRLLFPAALSEAWREKYERYLSDHQKEIVADIAEREDMDELRNLCDAGAFSAENIEQAIELLSRCQKTEMLGYLMAYKQEKIGVLEFDFSL